MVGLIILGIGIPTGLFNIGQISSQLEGDLAFRTSAVLVFIGVLIAFVLWLQFGFNRWRVSRILAGLIVIESVVLGITAIDYGWTNNGLALAVFCVLTMVGGWALMRACRPGVKTAA